MGRANEKLDLAQALLSDCPLLNQMMEVGKEMEALHKKISRCSKVSDGLMIQAIALSSQFEFCLSYLMQGRTDRLEFSPLYED